MNCIMKNNEINQKYKENLKKNGMYFLKYYYLCKINKMQRTCRVSFSPNYTANASQQKYKYTLIKNCYEFSKAIHEKNIPFSVAFNKKNVFVENIYINLNLVLHNLL